MPNRDFDTGTWTDPWFEALNPLQKLLFIYLWTNDHCKACGMYYISLKRIAEEVGLTLKQVGEILPTLSPKILYDESCHLLWVRSFVRKQRRGDTFLVAVSKSLAQIKPHPFLKEFSKEYQGFKIAYLEAIDSLLIGDKIGDIPVLLCSVSVKEKGKDRGMGKGKEKEKPEKKQYHEFVFLTEVEYESLVKRFGKEGADQRIFDLNLGIGSKGYKYVSHYHAILKWEQKAQTDNDGGKPGSKYTRGVADWLKNRQGVVHDK